MVSGADAVVWQAARSVPPLGNKLHIWRAQADALGCSALPAARKNRELASRLLARLLHGYLGEVPEILREERGRPYIPGRPLDFNLSHSGDWVVAAVVGEGRVGVDIERVRPDRDLAGIALRFFAYEEARAVERGPLEVFYRLWTAKEAALKLTGQGLSGGLDTARPEWNGASGGRVRMGEPGVWPVRWFEVAEGFAGAVVVSHAELPDCEFLELA